MHCQTDFEQMKTLATPGVPVNSHMHRIGSKSFALLTSAIVAVCALAAVISCAGGMSDVRACADPDEMLQFGYYAYFEPVSFVNPDEMPFRHYGFESDLVTALEAIDGANLAFERSPIEAWEGIWLKSSDEFDVVGGGITILESRTTDETGADRVRFTDGHIAFRQSLLTRGEDAERLTSYDALSSDVIIGALAGTTGEARLLQLVGLADADGVLVSGVTFDTPGGEVVTDGTSRYFVTAAAESPELHGRTFLVPPSDAYPSVRYLGDDLGEIELLNALTNGDIDGVARGEIGNTDAASASEGKFAVPILDSESEWGGFTVSADNGDLLSCLNEHIDYLTDDRKIGYAQWLADPEVFMNRTTSR